jgi:hypothetical protein
MPRFEQSIFGSDSNFRENIGIRRGKKPRLRQRFPMSSPIIGTSFSAQPFARDSVRRRNARSRAPVRASRRPSPSSSAHCTPNKASFMLQELRQGIIDRLKRLDLAEVSLPDGQWKIVVGASDQGSP